ncbi:PEP-CTERM sorting domain-containing protein [Microcoleus sp. C2C3]|uniref:PEP-CTERM sorting domain-containing protein n=1 Tax=unclassified Microcoleus TaxID=2642155 RepID=UPI002FD4263C
MKRLIRSLVIASGGLFLAATASNAASISFRSAGEQLDTDDIFDIQTSVGQLIVFELSVDTTGIITTPNSANDDIEINFSILVDPTELLLTNPPALGPGPGIEGLIAVFGRNRRVDFTSFQVKVLEGLFSNGDSDFTLKVNSAFAVKSIRRQDVTASFGAAQIVEVQPSCPSSSLRVAPNGESCPVPEPTTIFGSALALSLGGWLKRKKLSRQDKTAPQH